MPRLYLPGLLAKIEFFEANLSITPLMSKQKVSNPLVKSKNGGTMEKKKMLSLMRLKRALKSSQAKVLVQAVILLMTNLHYSQMKNFTIQV